MTPSGLVAFLTIVIYEVCVIRLLLNNVLGTKAKNFPVRMDREGKIFAQGHKARVLLQFHRP